MMRSSRTSLVVGLMAMSLAGCFSPAPIAPVEDVYIAPRAASQPTMANVNSAGQTTTPEIYVVQPGESLHLIAFRYGVNYRDVITWNRIKNPDRILAGQKLRLVPPGYVKAVANSQQVPNAYASTGASTPDPVADPWVFPLDQPKVRELPAAPPISVASSPVSATATPVPNVATMGPSMKERVVAEIQWRWPMQGKLKRKFRADVPGRKGIQIGGKLGQGIWAASAGEVVYSGSGLPGYGRLIIIKHSDEILSAYGYLGKIKVKEGEQIKPGQIIAEVGASPENKPVLHFEIRKQGDPVNPLDYLPG